MNQTLSGKDEVTIRAMGAGDVPFAMEVKNRAGWNQTARDWAGYMEYEPEGCFVAEAGGKRAGTAMAISYGKKFGWIGMVLVHPEARRLGIGTKLLRRTIEYLQGRGVKCVKLDATAMGRQVYVPMGFLDEYELSRYEGVAPAGSAVAPTSAAVQFMTERDLAEVAALDAEAFGAERMHVLRSMSGRNPEFCFVRREGAGGADGVKGGNRGGGGRVTGFLIARMGQSAVQVGPWIARDAESADELWRAFLRRVPGQRVFVDVPHPNAAGLSLVRASNFNVQRGFSRMFLGENLHPGRPEWVFGTSSAEKG